MVARYGLALIGVLYLGLSIWCATQQGVTSQKVGLTRQSGQGESEYLTIYGGLQLGMALMFLLPLVRESTLPNMLLSCVLIHASLVFFRTISFIQYDNFPTMTYQLASAEWGLLIISGAMLWYKSK